MTHSKGHVIKNTREWFIYLSRSRLEGIPLNRIGDNLFPLMPFFVEV